MFHEFGHALHGLFASQVYPTLSGTNVARDFVEFPSQFNEHWALDPKVLAHYAQRLSDRRADAAGAGRQDQARRQVQPGLCAGRGDRRGPARHGLAQPAGERAAAGRRRVRGRGAGARWGSTSPTCRRATGRAISSTSGRTAIRPAITPICGREMLDARRLSTGSQAHGGLTRANGQRFRDLILSRGHTLGLRRRCSAPFTARIPTSARCCGIAGWRRRAATNRRAPDSFRSSFWSESAFRSERMDDEVARGAADPRFSPPGCCLGRGCASEADRDQPRRLWRRSLPAGEQRRRDRRLRPPAGQ